MAVISNSQIFQWTLGGLTLVPRFFTLSDTQEGVKITPTYISSSVAHTKKIPKSIPIFSRPSVSMVLTIMLPEVGM